MEVGWDLVEWLGPDTSTTVLGLLSEPADLVRASAVSRSWRRFVVSNGFCKNLCLRMCPELSNFTSIMQIKSSSHTVEDGSSTAVEWDCLETEHRVYSYLSHCMVLPVAKRDFILQAIGASSTDNFPDESIDNTLVPSDRVDFRPSYWSSSGERDTGVPETLTYKLNSKFCIVDEINIWPFRAYFQYGYPIYSAKAVRFRMGYRLTEDKGTNVPDENATGQVSADEYIWTYVSPAYLMAQEDKLQSFKLPRPVICIGGIVQIELLGRVQRQQMDDLYYICVCHVQVIGCPLSPAFDVDILETTRGLVLKYLPDEKGCHSHEMASENKHKESSGWHAFAERIRQLGAGRGLNAAIVDVLLGAVPIVEVAAGDGSDEEP